MFEDAREASFSEMDTWADGEEPRFTFKEFQLLDLIEGIIVV